MDIIADRQGFSIGLNQMTLVSYLSEVAPVRARGALVANYSIWVSPYMVTTWLASSC